MKILFFGDVVGRGARDAIAAQLPDLRKKHKIDAVIVNAENAAHGFGLTAQICADLYKAGVDCITTGNHVWDQREIIPYIDKDPKLLRVVNFPEGTPGRGTYVIELPMGGRILVVHLMARLFMDALDDPFAAVDKILKMTRLGKDVQAVVIDLHGEATSEKQAMGYYCDGRASLVVGTHTHTPTADTRIMPGGTGFQTDAGMCGNYDSVIGMDKHNATQRFVRKMPGEKLAPSDGPVTLCGVYAEIDPKTGLCRDIRPVRIGGPLMQSLPP